MVEWVMGDELKVRDGLCVVGDEFINPLLIMHHESRITDHSSLICNP